MGANFVDDESGDLLRSSVGPMQLPVSLHKLLVHRPGLYLSESAPNFLFLYWYYLKGEYCFRRFKKFFISYILKLIYKVSWCMLFYQLFILHCNFDFVVYLKLILYVSFMV